MNDTTVCVFLGYLTFIQYKDRVKNDKKNSCILQARKSRVRILKITFIYLSKYFEFSCWISSRLQKRNFKNVSVIYYLIFTLCQNRLKKCFLLFLQLKFYTVLHWNIFLKSLIPEKRTKKFLKIYRKRSYPHPIQYYNIGWHWRKMKNMSSVNLLSR